MSGKMVKDLEVGTTRATTDPAEMCRSAQIQIRNMKCNGYLVVDHLEGQVVIQALLTMLQVEDCRYIRIIRKQ